MTPPLLELKGIAKAYAGVQALKGVDFTLHSGEVHALLGENGAGKSTLIRVVTGAHQPDAGSISIDGRALHYLTPRQAHALGIACIYQQPALFPELTVAENIGLRLEPATALRRIAWKRRRQRARDLLSRIGASIDPESEVRELSMPEQQLVEIACTVGAGARVIVMDEPTASLTRNEQEVLFTVVRELRSQGAGIIYISHRLEEIFALADRVTVLRDGSSVGSTGVTETDEARLIRMMVGRELSQVYPEAADSPGDALLSIRELHAPSVGIRNVSFEVRSGEVFGLSGLVGAGRTELAHALFGLAPITGGTVTLLGKEIRQRNPAEAIAEGIAYVPEDRRRHGIIGEMPVAQNVTMAIHRRIFPASLLQLRKEDRLSRQYIDELSIRCAGSWAPASSLSGGNQQKVSVARWLATKPRLLILDEPTQGVDIGAKVEIHRLIRSLASQGIAVLLISSDLPEVIGMSDRIGVMRGGTLAEILPGRSEAPAVMAAALGQPAPKAESG
jgi:rhamnose transport system ATP-binding protein